MAFVLGVTGGIGCGKTAVTDRLATHGVDIIDADIVAAQVVEPNTQALTLISKHFGPSILQDNGELNRPALREIIFKQPKEKQWLEDLLHPLIRQNILEQIDNSKPPYCVLVAPLLLEGDLHRVVDRIVVVDCTEAMQIERATKRDHSDKDLIKSIIAQQMSRAEKLKKADVIISNEGTLDQLHQKVDQLHTQLTQELTH